MSSPVSRLSIVSSIVRKDLREYGRDRLWVFLTALVLVAMTALFWILPNDVDESITLGVSGLADPAVLGSMGGAQEQGLRLVPFAGAEDLRSVVAREATAWTAGGVTAVISAGSEASPPEGAEEVDVRLGIAFPPDFLATAAGGGAVAVEVFADGAVPPELQETVAGLVREIAYALSGDLLPVGTPAPQQMYTVLGEDRAGNQVTPRESFRPLFVFLALLMEMFAMSSLIAREIQDRTVTALLVTPARTADVLAAKGITGTISGLGQAVILLVAFRSLDREPLLILTLMLLGAIMVSGTAMIAGSAGKDFIGTLFYGMVFMIPLLVPAFSALFPGTASAWIRALPSYPLVAGLVDVGSYGAGWAETLPRLAALSGWGAGLFVLGWLVLKRRVETV